MDGPIITVDVSKGNCHYQPWLTAGHSLRKPKVLKAQSGYLAAKCSRLPFSVYMMPVHAE